MYVCMYTCMERCNRNDRQELNNSVVIYHKKMTTRRKFGKSGKMIMHGTVYAFWEEVEHKLIKTMRKAQSLCFHAKMMTELLEAGSLQNKTKQNKRIREVDIIIYWVFIKLVISFLFY